MKMVDQISDDFVTDPDSNEDTTELYFMTSSRLDKIDRMAASYFDMYGTLKFEKNIEAGTDGKSRGS